MPPYYQSQYLAPSWQAKEDYRHGWLQEIVQDGELFLKSQHAYKDIDKAKDLIDGITGSELPKGMSKVHLNIVKRDCRENVATLANMRPLWGYKSDNPQFYHLTQILNKLLLGWYLGTFADRKIRKALWWGAICKGYISPRWKNDLWVTGRGDIDLINYGPRDVFFYQMGKDHDIQQTYVVTLKDEMPLALACAEYPLYIDKLVPDRQTPTWVRRGVRRVQKFLSPVLNRFGPGQGKDTEESIFPTVDIYRSYIIDKSFNDGPNPVVMAAGTNMEYSVPPYKSEIETGALDTAGHMLFRKATLDDSMLFPLRRLIKWTNQGIIYDGTAPDWHGKVPLVGFDLDDSPWSYLGHSMVMEGSSAQESATRLMRAMDDSSNARLDPALQFDENSISNALMERFNPRKPGQRLKTNLSMGEGVKPVLTSDYYDVPAFIQQHVENLWEKIHYVLGTRDIQAIAKSRQIPAGDSLEKMMELAGPIVTDMSRNMESSMRDLGEIYKADAMQYYDIARRVAVLGKDGATEEDFDYDPRNMIPSHLPDEMARIKDGTMDKNKPSRSNIVQRARAHINSCYFHVTPNSLHQITQLTKKMMLMQLFIRGFPVDPWTVAEAMDIPNYGNAEALKAILGTESVPSDVFGRWIMWKELLSKLGGDQQQRGRKPSGQQSPAFQGKDGGTRTTMRESPR